MANADTVIVELIAKTEGLDRPVKQAAQNFENAATRIETAGKRIEATAGQSFKRASVASLQASTQMYRGFADVSRFLESPSSPFVLPAKQAPVAATALKGLSLAGTALGGVLGGVVALGASAAVAAIADLIIGTKSVNQEIAELIEKLKEKARQTRLAEAADRSWKNTIEGFTESLRQQNEELDKSLQTARQRAMLEREGAQRDLATARRTEADLVKKIAAAEKRLAEAQANLRTAAMNPDNPGGVAIAASAVERARGQLERLKKELMGITVAGQLANEKIEKTTVLAARVMAEDLTDPIKAKYQAMRDEAEATIKDLGKLAAKLAEIDKLEKKAREKPGRGESGREVTGEQAAAIARAAGFQVNSISRTYAQQKALYDAWVKAGKPADKPVAAPGTSAHEGTKGRWALDIQMAPGMTPDLLRKVFAAQGISLSKVLKERNIFHVEGKRGAADSEQAAADKAAADARRNEEAYLNDLDALNSKILQLKEQQTGDIGKQTELQFAQIELAQKGADRAVKRDLEEGKIDEAKARQRIALNAQVAEEEKNLARQRERQANLQRQDELEQRKLDYKIADLQFEDEFSTSRKAHLDLQLQIVDLVFEQRIKHLETLKAQALLAGEIQKAADIQAEINRANIEHGQARVRTKHDNQSPLQREAEDAMDITDELEGVGLDAINGFTDALTGAIMGTKSLKQAFSEMAQSIIADILQMIIKMLIYKALQSAFGFGMAGGGEVPARRMATGGRIIGPGTGTSDSVPIMASAGEFVIRKRSVDKLGAGALHYINRTGRLPPAYALGGEVGAIQPMNRPAIAAGANMAAAAGSPILFDLRGAVVTEDLLRQMNAIAARSSAQAAKGAFEASQKALPSRLDSLNRLGQ